jgi:hypothetical protein
VSVDVRCRTHLCRIAVIVRDPDGVLVLETSPETAARCGCTPMRVEVPWTGDGILPPELGYDCPRGHEKRPGVPLPLSFARIRAAWESGKTLIWP